MKLDMNLHFWANSFNVTHCNEQEEIIEKPKSETTLSELQLNFFPQPLDKRHNRVFIVREIATYHLTPGFRIAVTNVTCDAGSKCVTHFAF